MKILITHNDYGRRSGEEAVVDKMGEMMKTHGHQVCFHRLSTAGHQSGVSSVIPNSVPVEYRYPPGPGSYIAYVGRLSAEKGWGMFMQPRSFTGNGSGCSWNC